MSDVNRIIDDYWNNLGNNEDDRVWLDALSDLRRSFFKKADQIGKIITLLESLHRDKELQKTYDAFLAQAKKTYALKVLEVDALTGKPKKYKIIETNQGGKVWVKKNYTKL